MRKRIASQVPFVPDSQTEGLERKLVQFPHEKVRSLEDLAILSARFRGAGRRVVLCHGTYDLLHMGHIKHLQRARQEGDVLLVTVTADAYVSKGPGRPVFAEALRAEALAALECVDYVAIVRAQTAIPAIEGVRPHVYVKGSDYREASEDLTGNISREAKAVEAHGGTVVYTDEITYSSSSLLNEHFGVFPPETRSYLHQFAQRYRDRDVIDMMKGLSKSRVLVVGDAIVDEYHYVKALGQTGKGNVLAVQYQSAEQFAGGSLAVANHLAGFVDEVVLVAGVGRDGAHESYLRSKLAENVTPQFYYFDAAPTVVKRRYVDSDMTKLFEVYFCSDQPLSKTVDRKISSWIRKSSTDFDLVLVPDYGNGFITDGMVDALCETESFLAVNTQVNSGNRGYHVINRYRRADFVSLNEPELRLAYRSNRDPLETVVQSIAEQVSAKYLAVTRGTKGAMLFEEASGKIETVPALSSKVVDRIGAGDAYMALSGLCLAGGLPPEVAGFIGSAAAALDVQIICNREPINPTHLYKYITTLMK